MKIGKLNAVLGAFYNPKEQKKMKEIVEMLLNWYKRGAKKEACAKETVEPAVERPDKSVGNFNEPAGEPKESVSKKTAPLPSTNKKQKLHYHGFVQLFTFTGTLSGCHAWGGSQPLGKDDDGIGDKTHSYRVWQCIPMGETEGIFFGLKLFGV